MIKLKCSSTIKFAAFLMCIAISACPAPIKTAVNVKGGDRLSKPSSGAIVFFPTHDDAATGKEVDFIRCLKKNLNKQFSKSVRIIDTGLFQDQTFPWFEPQYAPNTIDEMNTLLSQKMVRERISSLGVQYLITIASLSSDVNVKIPGIICGAGYGGAGCLGIYHDSKKTEVNVVIFDIIEDVRAVTLSANTSGKSYGLAFVVPVVFSAYTESAACKALSDKLAQLIIEVTEVK